MIAAPRNATSGWLRVVDAVSLAVFEQEIAAYLLTITPFLRPGCS